MLRHGPLPLCRGLFRAHADGTDARNMSSVRGRGEELSARRITASEVARTRIIAAGPYCIYCNLGAFVMRLPGKQNSEGDK